MNYPQDIITIKAYCNDCAKVLTKYHELRFQNFTNNKTEILCEACFEATKFDMETVSALELLK